EFVEPVHGAHSRSEPGASRTFRPLMPADIRIWHERRDDGSTAKASSSRSSSSVVGRCRRSTQSSSTETGQEAHAQAPPHAALTEMPQSRITSITRQPSSAGSACSRPWWSTTRRTISFLVGSEANCSKAGLTGSRKIFLFEGDFQLLYRNK